MADRNFQSNNSTIIIDHTKISTPTDILIKGTNRFPERKNLLCKDFFKTACTVDSGIITMESTGDYGNSNGFLQRYGPLFIFNNRGSNFGVFHRVIFKNIKEYLDPKHADKDYTLTFKIHKVSNFKKTGTIKFFHDTVNFDITNTTSGIFSVCGKISQSYFNNNYFYLIQIRLEDTVLVKDEEIIVELELISLELGDHRNDPLLFMPEYPFESVIPDINETPFISNNIISTLGEYRLDGEISLFLQQIEDQISEMYDFFSPGKQELNLAYTFLRR